MWLDTAVSLPELLLLYREKYMFLEQQMIAREVSSFYFSM